jgi:hypothetical protein
MFVCCECCVFQVEVSATVWSLVQRSPTDRGVSLCVIKKPRKTRRLKPATGLWKIHPQWVVTPGKQQQRPSSWTRLHTFRKLDLFPSSDTNRAVCWTC